MSFPNPDNYARDCDCGTAGANTTPPPATIQGEIDSLDTRVTALEETNDVIVSSGGIAALTTAQQALIREGSIVVTTDGKRWVYSGAGSKVLEASYIELSDLTIGSTANLPLITGAGGVITAGSFGSSANTFCQGNDSRLSDARTPLSHTHGNISNGGFIGTTANLPIITGTGGLLQAGSFGTTTNTFCQGDDVRVNHVRPLGANNVFVGNTALASGSLSGVDNTATGLNALFANTTGGSNTATGAAALASNTTGDSNTATGAAALLVNSTGSSNTATGVNALTNNTTGGSNSAFGANALQANTTGADNTATGRNALLGNTTGADNTATGVSALRTNTTGGANTATGVNALFSNTTGIRNIATGVSALSNNTTGASNVALGFQAGSQIGTGSNNICIGSGANVDAASRANSIALGAGAIATVDGQIAFASTLATKTTIGANGGATALTALPVGYIRIRIGTTNYQIPYYNE